MKFFTNVRKLAATVMMAAGCLNANADVDPNFHIYLCFGQSNMEGNAQWETVDNYVDPRFQMLATCNFNDPRRTQGQWYTANCPIVSPAGKLGPTDYFGRTMVAAMPSDVKIGVIAVAMGGSPIEMFDKDKYKKKLSDNPNEWWATLAKNYYGGNPYGRLIEMGKKAQKVGVIKGILLHQGCSNCGDPAWPDMVKKIYNDMLNDLGLQAEDVPLFVGEVEYEDMGGGCSGHNAVVAKIPSVIPTGHVVHANGIPGNGTDPWHFSPSGYRTLGKRYAYEALKVMGRPTQKDADYKLPKSLVNFLTMTGLEDIAPVTTEVGTNVEVKVWGTFADNHREDLTREITLTSNDFTFLGGKIVANEEMTGTVTATYTDFTGQQFSKTFTVEVTGSGLGRTFTSVAELQGQYFAIVNEAEEKVFYGITGQDLGYDSKDKAVKSTNSGYLFKLEESTVSNGYLLRLITPEGKDYELGDGTPGYLNTQAATGTCCFIQGLNDQNGHDIKNGAVWTLKYTAGKGFSLKNVGTGKYLKDAGPAKSSSIKYFTLCTLGFKSGIDMPKVSEAEGNAQHSTFNVFDLQGRRLHGIPTKGLYILNGKKYSVKY